MRPGAQRLGEVDVAVGIVEPEAVDADDARGGRASLDLVVADVARVVPDRLGVGMGMTTGALETSIASMVVR